MPPTPAAVRAAAIPLLLLALAGCSGSSGGGAAPAVSRGATTVVITGDDQFRFGPMQATAPSGPVRIRFEGKGSYPHDIRFPALHKTSASTTGGITGNTVVLDLGNLSPGRYAFVCDYHVGAGMRGVLTVS